MEYFRKRVSGEGRLGRRSSGGPGGEGYKCQDDTFVFFRDPRTKSAEAEPRSGPSPA